MNQYRKLVRNRKRKEEEFKKNLIKVPCGDTPIIIDISSNKEKERKQNEHENGLRPV